MTENQISNIVIGSCIKIHQRLGPGLLESVYENILFYELKKIENLNVVRQKGIPVIYDEINFEIGFRADLIVENKVLVELKSVENIHDVHKKQVLTYLRLTEIKLGLLINFNESLLKNGITRIVNNL
jgi:GxxExxY protein